MPAADYRILTDATGQRIATALEAVSAMVGPPGEVSEAELTAKLADKADVIVDTASGAIASFPDGMAAPAKDITIGIEPVQAGSGDPSPENVRPISGWTGANVTRTGKNLFPMTVESLKLINAQGVWNGNVYTYNGMTFTILSEDDNVVGIRVNGTSYSSYNYFYLASQFQVKSGSEYIISGSPQTPSTTTWRLWTESASAFPSGNRLSDDNEADRRRTASSDETVSVYIQIFAGQTLNNLIFHPMIRLSSSSDPTFAPCSNISHTISWETEAGTVYGGTLDVTTGLLTVTMAEVDLGPLQWFVDGNRMVSNSLSEIKHPASNANVATVKCSNYQTYMVYLQIDKTIGVSSSGLVYVYDSSYSDASSFKAAMSGVQLVYELATPQTYQLAPTEVELLLGDNNVWADTGDSTVTYRADTKLYIQKINAPTDDDMIADAQIASGKYFIIGGNLYRSTTTIPAGDIITPGTNCILTNLADALNALNI